LKWTVQATPQHDWRNQAVDSVESMELRRKLNNYVPNQPFELPSQQRTVRKTLTQENTQIK